MAKKTKEAEKGLLCIDLSLVPDEIDIVTFFLLLEQKHTIFYDSRKNPKALPPYFIRGNKGDLTVLDIADEKVRAKFELMIKIEELEENNESTDRHKQEGDSN